MTGKERVLATVLGKKTDKLPVIPFVLAVAAKLQGYKVVDYVKSADVLALSQLGLWRVLGGDGIFVGADNSLEAEALGSHLHYPDDAYPYLHKPFLAEIGEQSKLELPDFKNSGRMPEMLKACSMIKTEVGEQAVVIAKVVGPLTIASQLLGMENFLFAILDSPKQVSSLLEFTSKVCTGFALELVKHGADFIMVFDPGASPAVIPKKVFCQFALPNYEYIFSHLKEANVAGRWLHVVGPLKNFASAITEIDINMTSLGFESDFDEIRGVLPQTCLVGNIKPLLFQTGGPEDIKQEALTSLGQKNLEGIILSNGCEIPLEAPLENIKALIAARDLLEELKA